MFDWQTLIKQDLLPAVQQNAYWQNQLDRLIGGDLYSNLHLGIFVEPYLTYVLEGKKTVESRFSINRHPPYGRVSEGDILLLKRTGGPIVGICLISQVWFYHLDPTSLISLRKDFTQALCAQDPEFWKQREKAEFATLMRISDVLSISPVSFPKQDRRGWVILRHANELALPGLSD